MRLTTLSPSCADLLEILGASNSCSPQGMSRDVKGLLYVSKLSCVLHLFISYFNVSMFTLEINRCWQRLSLKNDIYGLNKR
jgi:hypothetical protein